MQRQILISAGALALALATGAEAAQSPVDRGRYIVTSVGTCGDCHSPMDAAGQVPPGRALTGAQLPFAPTVPMPVWQAIAPPIAGGPVGWTDAQLTAFLQTGKKPDGTMARPPMPAFRLNAEDAQAVAAYLKTLRPG